MIQLDSNKIMGDSIILLKGFSKSPNFQVDFGKIITQLFKI